MRQYLMGVDIGGGSLKVTLLATDGAVAACASQEYPTYYPERGFAEQDPRDWCAAFAALVKRVLGQADAGPGQILAISPDAATHIAVLLGADGEPLANAIHWMDARAAAQAERLNAAHRDMLVGKAYHPASAAWTLPQLVWLRENRPEILEKTRHIVFAKDFLRLRLTGRRCTDDIEAIGSMLFNLNTGAWDEELVALAGIRREWLPEILAPTDIAGAVTAAAAREFGLREGTPVLVGSTDTALEQLAAGSVEEGQSTIKLATAGRICVISRRPHINPFLLNYRHVVPGLWYPGTSTLSCAASYRWYRDALGGRSYEALDGEAAAIPPGCGGLTFHPYLQGEAAPYNDPALCASFVGVASGHKRAHFTRAVLEGVAYSLLDSASVLAEEGLPLKRTRVIGGGSRSALWRGIVADTLGVRLEKTEVDDSSFGGAMLAGVATGVFTDFRDAARRCVRLNGVTEPNAARHAAYRERFARYKAIHDALAPVYRGFDWQ